MHVWNIKRKEAGGSTDWLRRRTHVAKPVETMIRGNKKGLTFIM